MTEGAQAHQEESESAAGEGTQEACCAGTACECWRTWRGRIEKGIVIVAVVVVVVVVEQKPGIFPNKSADPPLPRSKRRKRQVNKGQPVLGPNSSRTTMAQGTSKLAEKQKKANKKTQNVRKGKRVVPPKKSVAVKQRQATKVRRRRRDEDGDGDRYSQTAVAPFGKDYTINRAAGSSRGLQWKTYDHEARRFGLKGSASTVASSQP